LERRKPKQSAKGNPQAGNTCEAITNTFLGGGSVRSSEEGSVMELERRDSIMSFRIRNNLKSKDDF
jgi:hypothetical protein